MFTVFDGFFTQNTLHNLHKIYYQPPQCAWLCKLDKKCECEHNHGVSYFLPSRIQIEMQASVVNFEL